MDEAGRVYRPPPSIAEAMRKVRTKRELAALFEHLRLRPRKSLGQNFLVDHNLLKYMVRAAEVGPGDVVLDVGCGTGLLAAHLADVARHVVGIELDKGLFAICSRYLEGRGNVTLLCGDALASKHALSPALLEAVERAMKNTAEGGCATRTDTDTGVPPLPPVLRVVSNLPYSVATLIVPNLLESGLPIAAMVVTVQKEVADRLVAGPGSGDYGALSLVVRAQAAAEVLRRVPPEVFWPRPKVTSAIVRLVPRPERRAAIADFALFKEVVRAAFAYRRKTLANALAASRPLPGGPEAFLEECGIAPTARAEELGLAQYVLLANRLVQRG